METILQTTNLSRQFGKKMAVNNVNMTIHKGDIYGFIGKNGAGKTTLLKLIARELLPTSGQIRFVCREESIDCIGSSQISFVPQESTLFRTTLKENLTLGKNNVREEKIKEVTGGVKSRCIPFNEEHLSDVCVCCGKPAKHMVYWGRAY